MNNIELMIDSLSYRIGRESLLNNINLHFSGYQVVVLLGPNGAGKSTLMKAMAASTLCQTGTVKLNGLAADGKRQQYLKMVGYMPETPLILPELTVYEQLQFIAACKNLTDVKQAVDRVIQACQLQLVLNKRTNNLSLGYKQRLNLAQALLNQPQLLIMDEPLNGLDPHLIMQFRKIIHTLKQSTLIVVSTHYLAEAAHISDRVIILQSGQIKANIDMKQQAQDFDIETVYGENILPEAAI